MKRIYKTLTLLLFSVFTQAQDSEFSGVPVAGEICESETAIALSADNDLTGTFSGEGIQDNGDGTATFNPSSAGAGTHDISYQVSDKFLEISVGIEFTLAIREDGTLWSWGRNDRGQLGIGNFHNSNVPVQCGTDNDWVKVAANGLNTSMGLKSDGTLWIWGDLTPSPVQFGTDNDWAKIEAGASAFFCIKSDGTLWRWGVGAYGQLGTGNSSSISNPTQLETDTWISVSSDTYSTLAIKSDGTLWAWGDNSFGQLGDGTTDNKSVPVQIGMDTDWEKVDVNNRHVLAIKSNGTLWSWGKNNMGQLGDGTLNDRHSPGQVGSDDDWSHVVAGREFSQALKTDHSRWGWGNNGNYAYQSIGVTSSHHVYVPTQYGTSDWANVSTGSTNSTGLKNDGTIWTWGRNFSGAAGTGSTSTSVRYITQLFVSETSKDISVQASDETVDIRSSCNSLTWIDGNTYTESNNTATHVLQNSAGCDSIVTLDLTILESTTATDVVTGCGSYTWIDGNVYTENNNTATFILDNAVGCDSIVTLNLTMSENSSGTDVKSACNSFTWIDGNTYTQSNNSATHILPNAEGCDSIVTLDLTLFYTETTTDVQTACEEFTWIDGNTYTESTNTATYFYTSAAGCDSIVTLNLEIVEINDEVNVEDQTLTANESEADYQWYTCEEGEFFPIAGETEQSFEATENGSYAVEISVNGCQVMSDCKLIEMVDVSTQEKVDFQVYPNPTNGKITLVFSDELPNRKVEILNSIGQQVQFFTPTSKEMMIELNGDPGVYFLRISTQKYTTFERIVKQ